MIATHEYTYTIPGPPMNYHQFNLMRQKAWNEQHQTLAQFRQSLTNQHAEQPLLDGPLTAHILFYFPIRKKQNHKHYLPSKYSFFNIIKFVQLVSEGTIITKNAYISQFNASILQSYEPRTVITFYKGVV